MTWKLEIDLLTLDEFNKIPNGAELISINGDHHIKRDDTDTETRFGYVAYGLASSLRAEGMPNEAEEAAK